MKQPPPERDDGGADGSIKTPQPVSSTAFYYNTRCIATYTPRGFTHVIRESRRRRTHAIVVRVLTQTRALCTQQQRNTILLHTRSGGVGKDRAYGNSLRQFPFSTLDTPGTTTTTTTTHVFGYQPYPFHRIMLCHNNYYLLLLLIIK